MTAWNDFNDADAQQSGFDLIPKGTVVPVRMTLKPGGYDDPSQGWGGGYATESFETGSIYLAAEFVVTAGDHAKRKMWSNIGLHSKKGPTWGQMGRSFIRAALNSARNVHPQDNSPQAAAARRIQGFHELDGLEFLARVDIEKDGKGQDRNVVKVAVEPDHPDYSQPVTIEHRIEDMAVVRDVQINGEISFTRPLTHAYPLASPGAPVSGSFVSSALVAGDLFARVNLVFDQSTWNGSWSDELIGSAATATFNHTQYPITVTNRGALTERWVVRMTNSTSFEVIGENVGVIATGNTSADCAPNNPATGVPYFRLPALGWGNGWATGNVLRFNTIGSQFPVWVVRTVQQGPESVPDDHFTLLIRGDVDTP